MIRPVIAVACGALLLAACRRGTTSPSIDGSGMLQPGHRELQTDGLRESSSSFAYYTRRTTGSDSTEQRGAAGQSTFQRIASGATFLAQFKYAPPQSSHDSLWMDAHTLRPRREWLQLTGRTVELEYRGRTVKSTVRIKDSAATSETTFPEEVFAFNQLETLIRSIPLRAGYQRVVPLYSEVDAKLEHDTITVIGPSASNASHWNVRFADPVIVQSWVVDQASHDVMSQETRPRRAPVVMRRVPGG